MKDHQENNPSDQPRKLSHEKRGTRSYVLRQGRMSSCQKNALEQYYDAYALDEDQIKQLPKCFKNQAPITCSIGFGMGEALLKQALKHPEKNFFGIEVHAPGVGSLMEGMAHAQVDNLLLAHRDVTTVIAQIPNHSIATWQIFFPDPWHKKRHHKRRLIQNDFLDMLVAKTQDKGHLHIATDWAHYAEHCHEVLTENKQWKNSCLVADTNYPYLPKDQCYQLRQETKYERRGKGLGHTIFDLYYSL
jgi:tRNA (guanine-N7-)-methyltransferase